MQYKISVREILSRWWMKEEKNVAKITKQNINYQFYKLLEGKILSSTKSSMRSDFRTSPCTRTQMFPIHHEIIFEMKCHQRKTCLQAGECLHAFIKFDILMWEAPTDTCWQKMNEASMLCLCIHKAMKLLGGFGIALLSWLSFGGACGCLLRGRCMLGQRLDDFTSNSCSHGRRNCVSNLQPTE